MVDGDVNRALTVSVLQIIESWIERDRAALARLNGMPSRHVTAAADKARKAYEHLAQHLPEHAHASLIEHLAKIGPRPKDAVGDVARFWASPDRRLEAARALLAESAKAQRVAEEHLEAARRIAEQEAARLAAEAERLAQEEADRMAAEDAEARRRAERAATLDRHRSDVREVLQRDFLSADAWFASGGTEGQVSHQDFEDWKAEFVQDWARLHLPNVNLDVAQARAIATTSSDLRIRARAGSGKTHTMVTRALFLQLHCRVDPGAIMLIAFNRNAVEEMRTRLQQQLPPGVRTPHVVTFHALAYALLRPGEELVFDDEDSNSFAQSRKVQAVVDDLLAERPSDVRRAMLGHFTDDWKRIHKRGLHMSREEFFAQRAEVTRVTLAGEFVKSSGERLIANTLFEHDIDYKYERNFTRGGFNYRPDFTVLVNGAPRVVLEYFGMMHDPTYQLKAADKRAFWAKQPDIVFTELIPSQIRALGEAGLREHLLAALDRAGVAYRRLDEDEIWQRVRTRAIDTFSRALRGFVNRARQLNLTPDAIRSRAKTLPDPSEGTLDFLRLAADVYEEYLMRSRSEGYEDFNGVMWQAATAVSDGRRTWTRAGGEEHGDLSGLRFVHIDEFQDFSAMFMAFIRAVRQHAPAATLCCVGDDWQAINGFAGADLHFFSNYETEFPGSITKNLLTNYRSRRRIVSAGNAIMDGQGPPARPYQQAPGDILVARLNGFDPGPTERAAFAGDIGTPALLRLLCHAMTTTLGNVAVLFRRNTVPWYTNAGQGAFARRLDGYRMYLLSHLDEEWRTRLEVTTSHRYKGREADYVIIADANLNSYPLVHPNAELFEVFGDTLDHLIAEDHRLFYVTTTRAKSTLCYLITSDNPSPFLGVVAATAHHLDLNTLPVPAASAHDARVEIRIYDGYEIRDTLKEQFGFAFDETSKTWRAIRPADGFDFHAVQRTLAFIGPRLIEVRDDTHNVIHRAGRRLPSSKDMQRPQTP